MHKMLLAAIYATVVAHLIYIFTRLTDRKYSSLFPTSTF